MFYGSGTIEIAGPRSNEWVLRCTYLREARYVEPCSGEGRGPFSKKSDVFESRSARDGAPLTLDYPILVEYTVLITNKLELQGVV